MQAREIFGIQTDDDMLYFRIANQPSLAYFSLFSPDFVPLNNEIFRQRFL